MARRPFSTQLAVDDVVKIMNDRIVDPRDNITIPWPVHCPLCRQVGEARVCMNRQNRDETNYGRILSICYSRTHSSSKEKILWLTPKLHPDDRRALRESLEDAVPAWSSSPTHDDAPHKRARSAHDPSGRRTLHCVACGGGRGAWACDKEGWCKDCCFKPSTCKMWRHPVGCSYHGCPPGEVLNQEDDEWEQVERRQGAGTSAAGRGLDSGARREEVAALPPTQAFHGPAQVGRRLPNDYLAFRQEQLRADEARKKADREARERSEELARLFDLVLFTKKGKFVYKVPAQPSDSGGLATRLHNWPRRVLDVVCAEVGEESDEVFIFEPDLQSWPSYDSTTYRTVLRGERVLCRLPGVGLELHGLQDEISGLPMPLRDTRRGAKRPRVPHPPAPLASPLPPPTPSPSPLPAAASRRIRQKLNNPVLPRLRRRTARSPSLDLDVTGDSPEVVDLSVDDPTPPAPPFTPTRRSPRPRLLDMIDASLSSPPPSPSLPPSSPPIPLGEILNNAWPGSRSFGTIYNTIKSIHQRMHRDRILFQDAFRELYGFDKSYGTFSQHAGYLNNDNLRALVDEYRAKPERPWTEFSRKARCTVTQLNKLNKAKKL
ncbi:hypothetical protein CALCODRAFT_485112 [Calocera cornea HHB12733]|uniref:Uncharacterized protein n=1 Tax=Calocera cornea HHB12733 TaxID=1353952 RepID=A0A165EJ05_9BASI|nr:hypothetical protein CALCODRAFT_485112 [Calocera cornea HHB12733]